MKLGALVIVVALGLDPFSQQLVKLTQKVESVEVSGGITAGSWRTELYNHGEFETFLRSPGPGQFWSMRPLGYIPMKASILNGISLPESSIRQQLGVQCPTGSCTWPKFDTLGVCHRCNDVTSRLRRVENFEKVVYNISNELFPFEGEKMDGKSTGVVLPNGHFFAALNGCLAGSLLDAYPAHCHPSEDGILLYEYMLRMTAFGTGNATKTNSMQDIDTLIWSMSIIHPDVKSLVEEWPVPVRATECALYYCVKTIETAVESNNVIENATEATDAKLRPDSWLPQHVPLEDYYSVHNIPPSSDELESLEYHDRFSYIARNPLTFHFPGNPSKPEYAVTPVAVHTINAYFQELFVSFHSYAPYVNLSIFETLGGGAAGFTGLIIGNRSFPEGMERFWSFPHPYIPETDKQKEQNLRAAFSALATSITNGLRTGADRQPVQGLVRVQETYYRAEWDWIVLHGVALVAGVITWYLTFANSATGREIVPAWKSCALPVISQVHSAAEALKGANTVDQMKQKAREGGVVIPFDDAGVPLQAIKDRDLEDDGDRRSLSRVAG